MVGGGGEYDGTQWLKITCVNSNYSNFTKNVANVCNFLLHYFTKLLNQAILSKEGSYLSFEYLLKRNKKSYCVRIR